MNTILKRQCRALIWTVACGTPCAVQALGIEQQETLYQQGEYRLTMTLTVAAPLPRVEAVIRDFAHYPELDQRIVEARVLSHPQSDQLELLTRINVCFAFLCRKVARVETVKLMPGELLATVQPDKSDAERGETHTVLTAAGEMTQVRYSTYIVPKFWVPSLFGRSLMLHTLRDATVNLFTHVEQRAQQPQ